MGLALTDERWSGQVVIGSGTSLSVLDVVAEVKAVSGAEFPVGHGPAKPGEMPAVIVDNSYAKSLGWNPQYKFKAGVSAVWEEWRDADIAGAGK
jgi:UDP-glucose 4-epimerase